MMDARLALPAAVAWVVTMLLIGVEPDSVVHVSVAVSIAALTLVAALLVLRRGARSGGTSRFALSPPDSAGLSSPRRRRRALSTRAAPVLGPTFLAVALVGVAVALHAPHRTPAVLHEALDGRPTELVVQLEVTAGPDDQTVPARIVGVRAPEGALARVSVPVRLLGLDVAERTPLGTTLEGRARLITVDPGDGRVALVTSVGEWTPTRDPPPLLAAGDGLRERFLALMAGFGGDGAVLLPGLAIGDTSAVPDDLDLAMKRSSLSHLTAVSGANCAIVVGLVLGLGALARWPRWVRILAALSSLGFFVVLVTPEPSVIRAAFMATAVLLAVHFGRPAQGLPILGLAVLTIIVIDPWISRQYGFVLSVLATGALLVLAGPIAERLRPVMPPAMALWIAVPLAAQLACQPVLILLQPEIPLSGVVANILAAPAAPIATIVGMIACVLAPFVPWLATAVAAVAWLPSAWIAGTARVGSGLPGSLLPWPEGAAGAVLLALLTIGALTAAGVPFTIADARIRRRIASGALVFAVAAAGLTAGADWLRGLGRPADWRIAQCDVGQGDAVLVRDGGETALIDTGAHPELLQACLDVLGVDRLDVLVLTHFDLDHVGAVEVVVGAVGTVLTGPIEDDRAQDVIDALAGGGARIEPVRQGDRGVIGSWAWTALWPPDHRGVTPGNDASLVLDVRSGVACEPTRPCLSLLALGDVGADAQRRILTTTRLAPVDVVKVSHHGSSDQADELYAEARARLALIGVGAGNSYGHPADTVLQTVERHGGLSLRSDLHGLVLIGTNQDGAPWVWHERGSVQPPGPARVTVGGAD